MGSGTVLFLFNDVVFNLGDPERVAIETGAPLTAAELRALSPGRCIKLVREAIWMDPDIARNSPHKARFLAALIGWKGDDANAMLALRPNGAKGAEHVQVRIASVGLEVMVQLKGLQDHGLMSARAANDAVWLHAPQRLRA